MFLWQQRYDYFSCLVNYKIIITLLLLSYYLLNICYLTDTNEDFKCIT